MNHSTALDDFAQRLDQGYGWLTYEVAVCVCAFGVGESADVNDLKSVDEVQRQLPNFGGKDKARTQWAREEIVQTLEELVKCGTLVKIGDMYRRSDRTCCRLITINDSTHLVAVVELFKTSIGIDHIFMLPPSLCDRYNSVVSEAIRLELNQKFSRGLLTVKQITAASACGRMTLSTQEPIGISGLFGQGEKTNVH
jgi:hypothetical protein